MSRTIGMVVWLAAAGTAMDARATSLVASEATGECRYVNGVWYCPCAPGEECSAPECIVIEGEWYCEEGR